MSLHPVPSAAPPAARRTTETESTSAARTEEDDRAPEPDSRRERLTAALEHVGHLLPAQAPLEVFVHHNTLHAFEHLPFHEAVEEASRTYGARVYLPEERYREAFRTGRIAPPDLDAAIAELGVLGALPPDAPGLPPTKTLARLVLLHGVHAETEASLRWLVVEKGGIDAFSDDVSAIAADRIEVETDRWLRERIYEDDAIAKIARLVCGEGPDPIAELGRALGITPRRDMIRSALDDQPERIAVRALWTACRDLSRVSDPTPIPAPPPARFPADVLTRVSHEDPDDLVHPLLITMCGVFLDRGQSHWSMPDRAQGFYAAWRRVMTTGRAVRPAWLGTLGALLRESARRDVDAEEAVLELLSEIGVADDEIEAFVEHTLLRLPGWAGMFRRLEHADGPSGRQRARVRLVDFLAVRLTLDVLAWADLGRRLGHRGPMRSLVAHCTKIPAIAPLRVRGDHDTAWPLFRVAQLAGLSAPTLRRLGPPGVAHLVATLDALHEQARLRVWHDAFERHYRDELLDAVADNVPWRRRAAARFQIVTCIDDRCESIRRHFEALSEAHETFGAAGFFNLAIAYQGIDDPSTFPLCPVVMEPRHRIQEEPASEHRELSDRRRRRLRRWGHVSTTFDRASRSLILGPLVTAASGFLAALPLLASVFAPWLAWRLRRSLQHRLLPLPKTRLSAERTEEGGGPHDEPRDGFTLDEKAERVGALLENIGLTRGFSPIVAIVGHDSSSVNNPHFAAYSCGACGGRSGGPNARLFARMANRPEVRERLRARGIDIPDSTVFVGAVHDTCADAIRLFDLDTLGADRLPGVEALQDALDEARKRDAHERCRKFASAPRSPTPDQALRHVQSRAVDLSQARPELGHATNASCIVGRRTISRGVFLDRRAFLVSYDPTADEDGAILERLLASVGPVGTGINLEYFFSTVDNEVFGAGTKLPHNVTGLVGVTNGASSDLRTGLPRQMIEIHEPIRLHMLVESTPATLLAIMRRQPSIAQVFDHEWARLAVIDPSGSTLWTYDARQGFLPYAPTGRLLEEVEDAADWYGGRADYVPPARITGPSRSLGRRRKQTEARDAR